MRLLAAFALAASLISGDSARDESPDPVSTLSLVQRAAAPARDLAAIRARIQAPPGGTWGTAPPLDSGSLWINDLVRHSYRAAPVSQQYVSEHADWLVEAERDPGDLAAAAATFESRILPAIQQLTGVAWTPGSNDQPRLAIFLGQTPGVSGYMSAGDAVPKSVFPYSNERPIVYLSLDTSRPGSSAFNLTLAHEMEHLAHFVINPTQVGWLDEGLAELTSNLVMQNPPPTLSRFRASSDVQLTSWSEKPWEARAHYEASYLWARYLVERGGGSDSLGDLIHAGGQGLVTVDHFLATRSVPGDSSSVFLDWLVANLFDDNSLDDGRFGYDGLDQHEALAGSLAPDGPLTEGQVHQYAGNYYDLLLDGPAELHVEVAPTVPLIGSGEVRGAMFWSLRGDNLDTRLTRAFDLTGLTSATLKFRVWHDLEEDYDYCYALGSSDNTVWSPLNGLWMTDRDTVGSAFGPGYTSRSGTPPAWLDEQVDLSAFAGGLTYIRFECVTDQSYSGPGFALDDISIPEIGFYDDASIDTGWLAEGFIRAPNDMAQLASLRVVEQVPNGLLIHDVPLDPRGRGQLHLDGPTAGVQRTVAILAGFSPATLEPMAYRLWLTQPAP